MNLTSRPFVLQNFYILLWSRFQNGILKKLKAFAKALGKLKLNKNKSGELREAEFGYYTERKTCRAICRKKYLSNKSGGQ